MSSEQIKSYIAFFAGIFVVLLFITWQQVVVFKLGYRITNLKQQIVAEEVKKQVIMEKLYKKVNLASIENIAKKSFQMNIPDISRCKILKVDKEKMYYDENRKRVSFLAYFKEFIAPDEAKAQ
jgi:hypothetical protein